MDARTGLRGHAVTVAVWLLLAVWGAGMWSFSSRWGAPRWNPPPGRVRTHAPRPLIERLAPVAARKAAHVVEFAGLWLLVFLAFERSGLRAPRRNAFLLCCLAALGDELHQAFIPNRQASLADAALDAGAALAAWKAWEFRERRLRPPAPAAGLSGR